MSTRLLTLLFSAVLFSMSARGEHEFLIMSTELPPYSFQQNDQVTGISTDILNSIMASAGHPIDTETIRLYPWARLYNQLQTEPGSVAYSMARTEERESLFKWVGPITTLKIGLLAMRESNIQIQQDSDLAKLVIGIQPNSAPAQLLVSLGYPETQFDYATTAEQNLKKLITGRIDAFGFSLDSALHISQTLRLNPNQFETIYILNEVELYYAFHPDTDDDLIDVLNLELKKLATAEPGQLSEVDTIIESYLGTTEAITPP